MLWAQLTFSFSVQNPRPKTEVSRVGGSFPFSTNLMGGIPHRHSQRPVSQLILISLS